MLNYRDKLKNDLTPYNMQENFFILKIEKNSLLKMGYEGEGVRYKRRGRGLMRLQVSFSKVFSPEVEKKVVG